MKRLLREGRPEIHNAAEIAGVSVRTLQRQLSSQGLSYTQLVQQARCEIAFDLLANSDARIIDVALETGYKDAANFTRAFRRWCGMSPRQFRKRGCVPTIDAPSWPRPAPPERLTPRTRKRRR